MDLFKQLCHPELMHTTSTEMHYTVYSICLLLVQANVCHCMTRGWKKFRKRSKGSRFSHSQIMNASYNINVEVIIVHQKKGGWGETQPDWASERLKISQCRSGGLRRIANSASRSMSDEWRLISRYVLLHYWMSPYKSLGGYFLSDMLSSKLYLHRS